MRRKTKEEFIEQANMKHGFKYDYSKAEYLGASEDIEVICPSHGPFKVNAGRHGRGAVGCPKCGKDAYGKKRGRTLASFISDSNERFNNFYDYSRVKYKSVHDKVEIGCPVHGFFKQRASCHLRGRGCEECAKIKRKKSLTQKLGTKEDEFVQNASKKHNGKYDYSHVKYINSKTKISIKCHEHGVFEQTPNMHLQGNGCPRCYHSRAGSKKKTAEKFTHEANVAHDFFYSYDGLEYGGTYSKVKICCPIHGPFKQVANDHLNGKTRCPRCSKSESKLEKRMRLFLGKNDIKYIQGSYDFLTNKKGNKTQLDFYLSDYKVAIEINGTAFHNASWVPKGGELKDKNYHLRKTEQCEKQGIELMHYFDFEDFDLFCQMLMSKIKKNKVIGASKCKIYEPTKEEVKIFFNENHIQGHCIYSKALGLKYKNENVQICTFSKVGETKMDADWEVRRLCTKKGFGVYKGLQKIVHNFLEEGQSCAATSNRYLGSGKAYENNGFVLSGVSAPSYWWVRRDGSSMRNRRMCNKDNIFKAFHSDLGYKKDELLLFKKEYTESRAMTQMGYVKVYNCGTKKWLYKKRGDNVRDKVRRT